MSGPLFNVMAQIYCVGALDIVGQGPYLLRSEQTYLGYDMILDPYIRCVYMRVIFFPIVIGLSPMFV